MHNNTKARQGLNRKEICRSKNDTHKIKWTNRVKGKNLILNLWAELDGSPGSKTVQENWQHYGKIRARKQMCSKLSAEEAQANFQQKELNKRFVDF